MCLLDLEHRWHPVDTLSGETQSDEFKTLNPAGQIPVLVVDNGHSLSESNAILNYLAQGTPFLPEQPRQRARVLQWQFFEQYSHEPYIAVARFIAKYLGLPEHRREEYEAKQACGHRALRVMEHTLAQQDYLANNQYSIADISLYAYTHVAADGGFDLTPYPALRAWLARLSAHPGHISIAQCSANAPG